MPGSKKDRPSWIRYSGIGIEFAAAVALFVFLGYWIGGRYGKPQTGILIGAGLGIVGGGYNLIRASLSAIRQMNPRDEDDTGDED